MLEMRKIKLTQNKYALVDNEDFEWLNQWKWKVNHGYAIRGVYIDGRYKSIFMHRVINKTPKGFETDHINRDRLDNRKTNLRTVTKSQNQHNRSLSKNNTSGINGVHWHKEAKKWNVSMSINGKYTHIGFYTDIQQAKMVRLEMERRHYA